MMWVKQCHKPHIWEWFIPHIKMVIVGMVYYCFTHVSSFLMFVSTSQWFLGSFHNQPSSQPCVTQRVAPYRCRAVVLRPGRWHLQGPVQRELHVENWSFPKVSSLSQSHEDVVPQGAMTI